MKFLSGIFILLSICFNTRETLENKSLAILNESRKEHPVLSGKKIRIDQVPANIDADIGVIVTLIKGKSLIQGFNDGSDSVSYNLFKNQIKLDVPKGLRKKCLSVYDFEGKVFNVVEIDHKKYVEIKLENKNSEIFYFIFEYDSTGKYQKYYHQYLIY